MTDFSTCLWFDGRAEEAARFYVSLFPASAIDHVGRAPGDYPAGKEGDALVVTFSLDGRPFMALNGGPHFTFNEAISIVVNTEDQAETDRLWNALTADGGRESDCGWLKDKFGLSWQITPKRLMALMGDPDASVRKRAFQAMMTMRRIDIAALEAAVADGAAA